MIGFLMFVVLLLCMICMSNIETIESVSKKKICVMAIFKNEEDYIEEWLEHHIDQGISHFYLYCNDPHVEKYNLNKFEKYITLISWTNKVNNGVETIQRQAYTHCIQNHNNEYDFIIMLDIDEFLINKGNFSIDKENKKVIDFINLLDNNKIKAIKVQRYDFGSNGHKTKPNGKVMDNYTKREKICSSYKTIASSKFINVNQKFYGVHDFPLLNDSGKIYNDYFTYKLTGYPNKCMKDTINETPLVINHYYTKSYEEYINRCKMWKNGGVNAIRYRNNCEEIFTDRDVDEVDIAKS